MPRFMKSAVFAFFAIICMATAAYATSPLVPMLQVDVKKGQIQEKPAIPAEDVRVSYMGVLHAQPIAVSPIDKSNNKSPDNLIAMMINANSVGDPVAMASVFLPNEQPKVMDSYQDPKLIKPNMAFFRAVTGADIHGYALIDDVIYLFVTFHGRENKPMVIPTVRTNSGYFLTNDLADKNTLAELTAAYIHHQITTLQ